MNRWLDRAPVLVFRLAMVTVAVVAALAVLMLLGMEWHDAARWMLRIMVPATLIITAVWVIGTLKEQ